MHQNLETTLTRVCSDTVAKYPKKKIFSIFASRKLVGAKIEKIFFFGYLGWYSFSCFRVKSRHFRKNFHILVKNQQNIDLNISVSIGGTAKLKTPLEAQKPQLSAQKTLVKIRQLTAEKMRKTLKKMQKNVKKC